MALSMADAAGLLDGIVEQNGVPKDSIECVDIILRAKKCNEHLFIYLSGGPIRG